MHDCVNDVDDHLPLSCMMEEDGTVMYYEVSSCTATLQQTRLAGTSSMFHIGFSRGTGGQ